RPEARKQLEDVEKKAADAEAAYKAIEPAIATGQAQWEQTLSEPKPVREGLVVHQPLDGAALDTTTPERLGDFRDGEQAFAPGIIAKAASFDGKRIIDLGDIGRFERTDAFSFGAWVKPVDATDGAVIARMDESNGTIGYNLYVQRGLVHLQFIHHVPDNMLTLVSAQPISSNTWHHVFATYDGSSKATGAKL